MHTTRKKSGRSLHAAPSLAWDETAAAPAAWDLQSVTDRIDKAAVFCRDLAADVGRLRAHNAALQREVAAMQAAINAHLTAAMADLLAARRAERAAASSGGAF